MSPVLIWPSTRLNIAPDNGAHYNTSSGKYCAEFYGTYIFILHLYKTGLREIAVCHIVKDDGSSRETLGTTEVQDGTITGSTSTILVLEKGDCVYVGNCGGYSLLSTLSSFSGALLDSLE